VHPAREADKLTVTCEPIAYTMWDHQNLTDLQAFTACDKDRLTCLIFTWTVQDKDLSNLVRFEVFTAVTMKNVVFWDIKTQFLPHRRHFTSPLQGPIG
jgi:hypothetical protein